MSGNGSPTVTAINPNQEIVRYGPILTWGRHKITAETDDAAIRLNNFITNPIFNSGLREDINRLDDPILSLKFISDNMTNLPDLYDNGAWLDFLCEIISGKESLSILAPHWKRMSNLLMQQSTDSGEKDKVVHFYNKWLAGYDASVPSTEEDLDKLLDFSDSVGAYAASTNQETPCPTSSNDGSTWQSSQLPAHDSFLSKIYTRIKAGKSPNIIKLYSQLLRKKASSFPALLKYRDKYITVKSILKYTQHYEQSSTEAPDIEYYPETTWYTRFAFCGLGLLVTTVAAFYTLVAITAITGHSFLFLAPYFFLLHGVTGLVTPVATLAGVFVVYRAYREIFSLQQGPLTVDDPAVDPAAPATSAPPAADPPASAASVDSPAATNITQRR